MASEGSGATTRTSDVQRFIDNQIEYYIDTSQPVVIALVRADAPQVKGRDIANFWAVYRGDDPESLPTELVARLDAISQKKGWKFYRDDPRFTVPWSVADAGVRSPEDLNIETGPLFTVKRLIEDRKRLDFGFRGYEQAAGVFDYFLREENDEVVYAIASNGRVGPVSDGELVLVPGHNNNFDLLSESTRNHIKTRYTELESETRSYYQDQAIEYVEAIVEDDDLTAVRTLEELQRLEGCLADSTEDGTTVPEFYSDHARSVVTRMSAIQSGTAVGNAPSPTVLNQGTRRDVIDEIRNVVTETRRTYAENFEQEVRSILEKNLSKLREKNPSTELAGLEAIEDRLSYGTGTNQEGPPRRTEQIIELIAQIEETCVLEDSEKADLTGLIRSNVAERKADLKSTVEEDLRDRIRTWIDGLPSESTSLALYTARKTESLQTAIRSADESLEVEQAVSRSPESFDQLVQSLHRNEIIEEKTRSQLSREFCNDLSDFRSEVVERRKKELRTRADTQLAQLQEDTRAAEEYTIVTRRQPLLNQYSDIEDSNLVGLTELVEEIDNESLFTPEEKQNLRSYIRSRLRNREKELRREEKEKLESRIIYYREDAVDSRLESDKRSEAIELLESVEAYLDGRTGATSLPDTLRTPYRRQLQILAGNDEHEILSDEDLEEIHSDLAESRSETMTKLREEEYEAIRQAIEEEIEELRDDLNDEPAVAVTVFKHLKEYLKSVDASTIEDPGIPDTPKSTVVRIQRVREIADRITDAEDVLSGEHQRRLRQILKPALDSALHSAREDLVDERVTRLAEFVEMEYVPEDATVDRIDESISSIESRKSAIQGQADLPDSILNAGDDWTEEINSEMLGDAHRSNFEERAVSTLADVIHDLKRDKCAIFRNQIHTKIDEIADSEDPGEAKIRELKELSSVLQADTTARQSNFDASVVSKCQTLPEETRAELTSHIQDRIQMLSEPLIRSLLKGIVSDLSEVLESTDDPGRAAETFESYVNENISIRDSNALRPACNEYDELVRLRDDKVISRNRFENARRSLLEEIQLMKENHGPDSQVKLFIRNLTSIVRRIIGQDD